MAGGNSFVPVQVTVTGNRRLQQIAAGAGFTCTLNVDGVAFCFGSNSDGQLGGPGGTPVPGRYTAITAGGFHACAIQVQTDVAW